MKFSLCATVLIFPPQCLLPLFFPCFGMLAFAGPPFLSRNLRMCFTRERKLECHRAILGPGQENVVDLKAPFKLLSCDTPRTALSSKGRSWALATFPRGLQYKTQQPGSWCQQEAQQCGPGIPTDLGVSHDSWNVPLRIVGSCLKTCDHGRALWFGPMNNSYFFPYFTHNISKAPKILGAKHIRHF